ncbi:hypothetical protein [Actinoplanes derwentensis]|nr:hypothetical protein [Actinoplanes derwentensis]
MPRPLRLLLLIGLPLVAAAALALGGVDAVASWQAKSGGGVAGVFTADRQECSRRTCNFHGPWQAADGSGSRPDVLLYDAPADLTVGRSIAAVDTGARKGVFTPDGGGSTFLITTVVTLIGLLAVIAWIVLVAYSALTARKRSTSR